MTRDELIEAMAKAQFAVVRRTPDNLEWGTCPQPILDAYIIGTTAALSAIEAAGFAIVPVVASEGIELAGLNASDGWIDLSDAEIIYSAMIQAAKDEMK
jgi:hypothetical protein